MKWVIVFGTFLELCSALILYAYLGKQRLEIVERKFIAFLRNSYKLGNFMCVAVYGIATAIMMKKYGGAMGYKVYLNPLFDNWKINFPFGYDNTKLIAYGFISIAFISFGFASKVLAFNPKFFIRMVKENIDIKQLQPNVQKKKQKGLLKKMQQNVEAKATKLAESSVKDFSINFILGLIGAWFYIIPFIYTVLEVFKQQGVKLDNIFWGAIALGLVYFYFRTIFAVGDFSDRRKWIILTFLTLAFQLTFFVYFCLANLHLTWNVITIVPFVTYATLKQIGCFTNLIVEEYSQIKDLNDSRNRFALYSFYLMIIGVSMQMIGSIF